MNCRPLYVGKNVVGDRFDDGKVFVFFGNKLFSEKESRRLFPDRPLKTLKQVHGNNVVHVDDSTENSSIEADGSFTKTPLISLGIYTADCLPVLFHDSGSGKIAACHAGWRGVANKIIAATVSASKFSSPENVRVWIGPHIRKDSFEVHTDVAETLGESLPAAVFAHESDKGKRRVDLTMIAKSQLTSLGILEKNIWIHTANTFTDENYFSFRRSGPTGRLISSISLL